jgi:hypothetical protein
MLEQGRRSMRDLLGTVVAEMIPITPDLQFYCSDLLRNINDPGAIDQLSDT